MSGMQMLMKQALGFDPEEISNYLETFMTGVSEQLTDFRTRLERMEAKIDALIEKDKSNDGNE